RPAPAVRAPAGGAGGPAGAAARRPRHGPRAGHGPGPGPLPGRRRGARPPDRGGRGGTARRPRRRRPVARPSVGPGAGVRGPPAPGGAGRAGSRAPHARRHRRPGRAAGAPRRRPRRHRRPRPAGRRRPRAARRAGPRPARRRDPGQPAGARRGVLAVDRRRAGGRLPDPTEQRIRRRLAELPARTRQLLLAAAAEPVGDPALLWRAAGRLGIPARAAASAEAAGLVDLGPRVRFRHPLVRAVAYRVAAPPDRRRVHRALAEATGPVVDPARRAWHRAQAALRPDESVAADLERTAGRARAGGGSAASAAFLARAAELTPDAGERARRALDAARATLDAGAFDAALALLGAADEGPDDPVRRARTQLVRAQVGFASRQSGGPTAALLAAGRRLAPVDPATARAAYLTAFGSAALAGRLADGTGLRDVAVAARRAPQAPDPQAEDLLLEGLVALFTEGYAAAVP